MPVSKNEMHGTITLELDSEAHLRAAMAIQRLIRVRFATRRLRTKISQSMFIKKLDMEHGKWFYVMKRTGESTWDVPRGQIPMALPPDAQMHALAKEKMEIKLKKKKESDKRQFLIEQVRSRVLFRVVSLPPPKDQPSPSSSHLSAWRNSSRRKRPSGTAAISSGRTPWITES